MIKGFFVSAIVVMLLGVISANILYRKTNGLDKSKNYTYLLELGTYDNKENLFDDTKDINDILVLKENDKYQAVVGISKSKNNLEKISKLYTNMGYNMFIKPANISNKAFLTNLEQFDKLLNEAKRDDEVKTINSVILSSYEEFILNKESM